MLDPQDTTRDLQILFNSRVSDSFKKKNFDPSKNKSRENVSFSDRDSTGVLGPILSKAGEQL